MNLIPFLNVVTSGHLLHNPDNFLWFIILCLIFFNFCRNMCGIWALFGVSADSVEHMDGSFHKIKHRGPDAWKIQYDNKVKVCTFSC